MSNTGHGCVIEKRSVLCVIVENENSEEKKEDLLLRVFCQLEPMAYLREQMLLQLNEYAWQMLNCWQREQHSTADAAYDE